MSINETKQVFYVYVEDRSTSIVKCDTREQANQEAKRLADRFRKEVHILEAVETTEPEEINRKVNSYGAAMKHLGRETDICMCGIDPKHGKAMEAIHKLITIAEAWNKADGFVPDYDNRNQDKWFPWFKKTHAGFVFANTGNTATITDANIGSRFCFKTSTRARQFGEQFVELWNDFLLFS